MRRFLIRVSYVLSLVGCKTSAGGKGGGGGGGGGLRISFIFQGFHFHLRLY